MKRLLFTFVCSVCFVGSLTAADRVALVIGINAYPNLPENAQLLSPRSDAADVAASLRAIGFTVLDPVLDGTRESIVKAKNDFLTQAAGAQIAVFYFSGHGVQVGDEQFLMPSDAPRLRSYTALTDSAIALRQSVMVGLEEAGAKTKVIILDCCRDNPFEAQIAQALAQMGKNLRTKTVGEITGYGPGFFLAFATSPGQRADDGNGARNSPFTAALLSHLKDKAGLSVRDLLDEVKTTVRTRSGEAQVPWVNDSLDSTHLKVLAITTGSGVLPGAVGAPTMPGSAPSAPTPSAVSAGLPQATTPLLATKSAPFVNSLGMKFVPVPGTKVLFCQHETRKGDYAAYARTNSAVAKEWSSSIFDVVPPGGPDDDPAIIVSWEDAVAFCDWLSRKEGKTYRLPTDHEWSVAVGIGDQESASASPESKNMRIEGVYPWGRSFPPRGAVGNYADSAAKAKAKSIGYIDGYTDGYATTAPVMSFEPNNLGLYDLGGNVLEWCEDWYNTKKESRVLRGGSWYDGSVSASLLSSTRAHSLPSYRLSNTTGFRCVLVVSEKP
jgi:hypothetical protein